ncbi:MAG: M48 family metalloprotease [Dehalococcoidia bacterium]|nr:M48 family metalloprotease [Dehalococcoidia bacterium]
MLDKLEPIELEGVLAHELSHIGNYDIRVMTLAVVLAGLIALVSDFFLRWSFSPGRRAWAAKTKVAAGWESSSLSGCRRGHRAPIIALAIKFQVSRQREYLPMRAARSSLPASGGTGPGVGEDCARPGTA